MPFGLQGLDIDLSLFHGIGRKNKLKLGEDGCSDSSGHTLPKSTVDILPMGHICRGHSVWYATVIHCLDYDCNPQLHRFGNSEIFGVSLEMHFFYYFKIMKGQY